MRRADEQAAVARGRRPPSSVDQPVVQHVARFVERDRADRGHARADPPARLQHALRPRAARRSQCTEARDPLAPRRLRGPRGQALDDRQRELRAGARGSRGRARSARCAASPAPPAAARRSIAQAAARPRAGGARRLASTRSRPPTTAESTISCSHFHGDAQRALEDRALGRVGGAAPGRSPSCSRPACRRWFCAAGGDLVRPEDKRLVVRRDPHLAPGRRAPPASGAAPGRARGIRRSGCADSSSTAQSSSARRRGPRDRGGACRGRRRPGCRAREARSRSRLE